MECVFMKSNQWAYLGMERGCKNAKKPLRKESSYICRALSFLCILLQLDFLRHFLVTP